MGSYLRSDLVVGERLGLGQPLCALKQSIELSERPYPLVLWGENEYFDNLSWLKRHIRKDNLLVARDRKICPIGFHGSSFTGMVRGGFKEAKHSLENPPIITSMADHQYYT